MIWNGLKFFAPTGLFLDAEENRRFWQLAEHPVSYVPWDKQGAYTFDDTFIDEHIQRDFRFHTSMQNIFRNGNSKLYWIASMRQAASSFRACWKSSAVK